MNTSKALWSRGAWSWPRASALVFALLAAQQAGAAPPAGRIDADIPALVARGKTLYAAHCAACHGPKLEGQPDWKKPGRDGRLPAPPHDESGHTWHHGDAELVRVVKRGPVAGEDRPPGYVGNMPAYQSVLGDTEIVAVLSFIKSTWSADYRAWQERAGGRPSAAPSAEHQRAKGDAFLAASLKPFRGAPVPMRQFGERPLIVYFWASGCVPCRDEAKALLAQRTLQPGGLTVVGVGVDQSDNIERVVRSQQIDAPVFVGGAQAIELSRRLGNLLGEMPFAVAIDRRGQVASTHFGAFKPGTSVALAAAALR